MTKKFKLKANRFEHSAGTICYRFLGWDYGCKSDDERATGVEHTVMTVDPNGGNPFFTVPVNDVEEI
jgi:hypothetical protein